MSDEALRNRLRRGFGDDEPDDKSFVEPRKVVKPSESVRSQPRHTAELTPKPQKPTVEFVPPPKPEPLPISQPAFTEVPVAKKRRKSKAKSVVKPLLLTAGSLAILVLVAVGVLQVWHKLQDRRSASKVAGASTAAETTIPLYAPKNLPTGYTFNNDEKWLKSNVDYFSITGPDKQMYFVTQQPVPENFDFVAFGKKFTEPDRMNVGAGDLTAGQVGANTIGSLLTDKATWIIINAQSTGDKITNGVEAVARSMTLK